MVFFSERGRMGKIYAFCDFTKKIPMLIKNIYLVWVKVMNGDFFFSGQTTILREFRLVMLCYWLTVDILFYLKQLGQRGRLHFLQKLN